MVPFGTGIHGPPLPDNGLVIPPIADKQYMPDPNRKSQFLALVLRHKPEVVGLTLPPNGWLEITAIIAGAATTGRTLTDAEIREIVRTDEKGRYEIDVSGTMIRACQGHSLPVDAGLVIAEPPEILYHGTASRFIPSIRQEGLTPRSRQHVHLSSCPETAHNVGSRHGDAIILSIPARKLHQRGHKFLRAKNGVWLSGPIPPESLEFP